MRKAIIFLLLIMLLTGLALAGDIKGEEKKVDTTVTDATKETAKEITKGITVKDKSSEISKYKIEKDKTQIKISKAEAKDKDGKQLSHTKTILTFDEKTARSIDVDKDGKFSVLRKVDGQVVEVRVVTLKELTTGIDTTFSEVIINGFTGYYRLSMALSLTANTNSTISMYVPNADILTITFNGTIPESLAFSEV